MIRVVLTAMTAVVLITSSSVAKDYKKPCAKATGYGRENCEQYWINKNAQAAARRQFAAMHPQPKQTVPRRKSSGVFALRNFPDVTCSWYGSDAERRQCEAYYCTQPAKEGRAAHPLFCRK
ncbi:MAG: hypothetical protein ACXWKC_18215 [Xanthobacteraceae bacterium]